MYADKIECNEGSLRTTIQIKVGIPFQLSETPSPSCIWIYKHVQLSSNQFQYSLNPVTQHILDTVFFSGQQFASVLPNMFSSRCIIIAIQQDDTGVQHESLYL